MAMATESLEDIFVRKYGSPVRSSGAQWVMHRCPECGRHALACNLEHGYVRCFHCGLRDKEQGSSSAREARYVDRRAQLDILAWMVGHCQLSPAYKRFLRDRGIQDPRKFGLVTAPWDLLSRLRSSGLFTNQQLEDSGLFYPDRNTGCLIPSSCLKPERLIIPYITDGKLVGIKSRVALSEESEEKSLRYLTPPGFTISQYLWNVTLGGQDLYLTEGELKAITGLSMGHHCASIPGLVTWSRLLPSLQRLATRYRRVFLVLDSDPGYQRSIPHIKTATALCSALPNSCILFLPQADADHKGALDTYLVQSSERDFLGLSEDAWNNRQEIYRRWRTQLTYLQRKEASRVWG